MEIKMLRQPQFQDLAFIVSGFQKLGWPDWIIALISKVDQPKGENDGRPVSIASILLRLWASLCARELLQFWGSTFPAGVSGAIPGTCTVLSTYSLQRKIEKPCGWTGLNCNIIKAFKWHATLAG